ncbi:hypothetical protein H5410_045724 [Solanum commersonii]|uniref:Uncharacterized protein n=1 Tax=Solanum commersonii TaxID=4109 RepID=A0A9J5XC17_SOLCO|nr:hypothetical protein H5410_045724 [Solanum commersonii]
MNDFWKPLNKLVTKVDTLDNSKVPVPKFISSSPLINLDDSENEDDDDNEEEDDDNVLFHFESREDVYSVAFSQNGEYMESGLLDKCMNIWLVKKAKAVKTYNGDDSIFEVCWNK